MAAIRAMTRDDIPQALALWRRTAGMGLSEVDSPTALVSYLERNPGLSVVAVDEGRVIGTALCGHDGRRGYLNHVAVDQDWRGQGLGRALVRASLAGLRRAGLRRCHLFVLNSNADGLAFWEHEGWLRRSDLTVFSHDIEATPAP